MKNNNMLILLIATLGIGIMCAIVAGIAFTYYNGGFDELRQDSADALQAAVAENQLSDIDTANLMEAVQDAGSKMNTDYIYLMNMMQKSQMCSSSLMVLDTSMAVVQIDPSILENEQNSAEILAYLEEAKTSCDGLGDNDELSNTYPELTKEYANAEKSIDEAIQNYQDYFKYKKSKYLEDGNDAYEEALEYLANAFEILQQSMTEDTQ